MITARGEFGAAVGNDGNIYAIGGVNATSALSNVEQFNPSTQTWTTRASLPIARYALGVVAANDGMIYALGGATSAIDAGQWTAEVDQYNPVTNIWTRKSDLATPIASVGALGGNGIIYVFGDSGVCVSYDPANDTSTMCATDPVNTSSKSVASGPDGNIYNIGGDLCPPSSSNELYNPGTNAYAARAPLPTARGFLASALARNGRIYAVGGVTAVTCPQFTTLATVEEYDPVADSWASRASMPTARDALAVVGTPNGNLYAIGGVSGTTYLTEVEVATIEP